MSKKGTRKTNGVAHRDAHCADGPATPLPGMREPLPEEATHPGLPRHKAIPPPPPPASDPPKLKGTRVQRTGQGLGVIWATLKVIWKVWTK